VGKTSLGKQRSVLGEEKFEGGSFSSPKSKQVGNDAGDFKKGKEKEEIGDKGRNQTGDLTWGETELAFFKDRA